MLMWTDPFRELDRLAQQFFGANGTTARPALMPMDAYRSDNDYVVEFDLPGVTPDSIDLDVERNVLTVRAERTPTYDEGVDVQVAERPCGVFARQLFLGDTLDAEHIKADYHAGVLTLRVPVAEQAKPRKIAIGSGSGSGTVTGTRAGSEVKQISA